MTSVYCVVNFGPVLAIQVGGSKAKGVGVHGVFVPAQVIHKGHMQYAPSSIMPLVKFYRNWPIRLGGRIPWETSRTQESSFLFCKNHRTEITQKDNYTFTLP